MRRVISLVVALALFGGGLTAFYILWNATEPRLYMWAGAFVVTFLGGAWIWSDYIDATPNDLDQPR